MYNVQANRTDNRPAASGRSGRLIRSMGRSKISLMMNPAFEIHKVANTAARHKPTEIDSCQNHAVTRKPIPTPAAEPTPLKICESAAMSPAQVRIPLDGLGTETGTEFV